MGARNKEGNYEYHPDDQEQAGRPKKNLSVCIAFLWSFLLSVSGGLLLGYWEYKYRIQTSQLWMVPLGLILLITPLIVWFALIVSEICIRYSMSQQSFGGSV